MCEYGWIDGCWCEVVYVVLFEDGVVDGGDVGIVEMYEW